VLVAVQSETDLLEQCIAKPCSERRCPHVLFHVSSTHPIAVKGYSENGWIVRSMATVYLASERRETQRTPKQLTKERKRNSISSL
jgi:hypothetical protein